MSVARASSQTRGLSASGGGTGRPTRASTEAQTSPVEERLRGAGGGEARAEGGVDRGVELAAERVRAVEEAEEDEQHRVDGARRADDRADGERRQVFHQRERQQHDGREEADPHVGQREDGGQPQELGDAREHVAEDDRVREAGDERHEDHREVRDHRGLLGEHLGPRLAVRAAADRAADARDQRVRVRRERAGEREDRHRRPEAAFESANAAMPAASASTPLPTMFLARLAIEPTTGAPAGSGCAPAVSAEARQLHALRWCLRGGGW